MAHTVLTFEQWKEKGENLFGKDISLWKFKCPMCGQVQTLQDFFDNDVSEPDSKFYFSCIGRWVKGRGCDWTLGGLFKIHQTEVINIQTGKNIPVFEFAE